MSPASEAKRVRTIFLSDVHLGTRACQAGRLLDFLRNYESDTLFLVGDIVDFWAMSRTIYWSGEQNTVVQKILKRARHGTLVHLVPGNHDELLREHLGVSFGDIQVVDDPVHVGVDGKRYLVLHGDAFDQVTRYHRIIAVLGDQGYALVVRINVWLSWWRRQLGIAGDWSLSGFVKRHIKSAVRFIQEYELAVARYAQEQGYDGVVCGHIHAPAHKQIEGVTYLNCGDWVDSCSALVEHLDGTIELVHWRNSPTVVAVGSRAAAGTVGSRATGT